MLYVCIGADEVLSTVNSWIVADSWILQAI